MGWGDCGVGVKWARGDLGVELRRGEKGWWRGIEASFSRVCAWSSKRTSKETETQKQNAMHACT